MTQAAYVSWKVTNADYANKNVMAFNASQMSAVTALLAAGGDSMVSDLTAASQGSATANGRGVATGTATSADSSMFFVVFDTTANTYAMTGTQDVSGSMYTRRSHCVHHYWHDWRWWQRRRRPRANERSPAPRGWRDARSAPPS